MTESVTKKGLPPVGKIEPPAPNRPPAMPPIPARRVAETIRQVPDAANASPGNRLMNAVKWMVMNANVVEAPHAPGYPETADIRKFAESMVSCEDKEEEASRVPYKLVKTANGGKYRLYASKSNMMSSEKWGIHVATLELRGERYFLYQDDPRRPWQA